MSRSFDDDLLAPELTEADDAVGFDRPWNPWSLVTLTFFFGLPAGGSLLALNFDRLGMPGRRLPALAIAIAAPQQQRFRLFQVSGQPAGHLLWPAVIASVLSLLYQIAVGIAAVGLFRL
jgi:hypothetical protein